MIGHIEYLVTLTRPLLNYCRHYGPMVSFPKEAMDDAQRLYGIEGWVVSIKPYTRASRFEKKQAKENEDERREAERERRRAKPAEGA